MSDGPHRCLPMRQAWKTLAAKADNSAFALDQVAEAACFALAHDWQAEVSAAGTKAVASVLGSGLQMELFGGDRNALTQLRSIGESPLMAAFVDATADAIGNGFRGPQAIEQAIEATLLDRALREARSVEEHLLRRLPRVRALNVRARILDAIALAPLKGLAQAIARGAMSIRRLRPQKRSGLDEGVEL